MRLYRLNYGAPGSSGSPERIAYLIKLDAEKQAFVKECDEFSECDGAMCGDDLARYVGEELLTHAILPGVPRFHMTYSEYSSGDPDMLVHTRSYLEGCNDGFESGYEAGFAAATEKGQSLGLKKSYGVTGLRKALKAYFEGDVQARIEMGEIFEPSLFKT